MDGSELPKTKIGAVLDVLKLYICFCMESRKRDEFCFCFGGVNIDGDDMINELSKESRVFSRPAKTLLQYLEKFKHIAKILRGRRRVQTLIFWAIL